MSVCSMSANRGNGRTGLLFFLHGVSSQSRDAIGRSNLLLKLWQKYRSDLQAARASALLLQLVDELFAFPAITNTIAAQKLSVTPRSAQLNIEKLLSAGILREATGKQRNRVYIAQEIISIVEEKAFSVETALGEGKRG